MNSLPLDYEAMLRGQGGEDDETWLNNAYLIGRRALEENYSVLDIMRLHHDVLIGPDSDPKAKGRWDIRPCGAPRRSWPSAWRLSKWRFAACGTPTPSWRP